MNFDFSNIRPETEEHSPIDPIEIFRGLRVRDPAVNDLWLGQAEALQPWHENRTLTDIAIGLNTGAGKTLVGLLLAQSLVNETRGHVLYACNSIQLVEQTRDKAQGYGMDVTTYIRGEYSNDRFSEGRAPCVTTYQALFNGKSVFARKEVDAVIFDDAHTAEGVLRDQFTLTVKHSEFPIVYNSIVSEFRDYFHGAGYVSTFEDIVAGASSNILIIPPFEIRSKFEQVLSILRSGGLDENQETLFSWEHLKDKLDICCYLLTSGSISISPPFIPVRTLPYFSGDVRRIYLSATLNAA